MTETMQGMPDCETNLEVRGAQRTQQQRQPTPMKPTVQMEWLEIVLKAIESVTLAEAAVMITWTNRPMPEAIARGRPPTTRVMSTTFNR
jgi:truncated hemoglobin YjbI